MPGALSGPSKHNAGAEDGYMRTFFKDDGCYIILKLVVIQFLATSNCLPFIEKVAGFELGPVGHNSMTI